MPIIFSLLVHLFTPVRSLKRILFHLQFPLGADYRLLSCSFIGQLELISLTTDARLSLIHSLWEKRDNILMGEACFPLPIHKLLILCHFILDLTGCNPAFVINHNRMPELIFFIFSKSKSSHIFLKNTTFSKCFHFLEALDRSPDLSQSYNCRVPIRPISSVG